MNEDGFALDKTFVHLGLGPTAVALPNFRWDHEYLEEYSRRFAADGDDGRLVCITPQTQTWTSWERHPAGDEVVVLLSGRMDVIQDLPDGRLVMELLPGRAIINPKDVWHTSDVHEPGDALFITPGARTQHKDR
jgi:mannose-6-phosphate isomerase-like protein (cupin superfamily)